MRQNAGQQRRLDFEILGDGFDHPVAVGQFGQIVVECPGSDERSNGWLVKGCRLCLCQRFESDSCQRTFAASGLGRQIQQNRWDARIGQVSGDARAHGASPQHGRAPNQQRLSGRTLSGVFDLGDGAHRGSPCAGWSGEPSTEHKRCEHTIARGAGSRKPGTGIRAAIKKLCRKLVINSQDSSRPSGRRKNPIPRTIYKGSF